MVGVCAGSQRCCPSRHCYFMTFCSSLPPSQLGNDVLEDILGMMGSYIFSIFTNGTWFYLCFPSFSLAGNLSRGRKARCILKIFNIYVDFVLLVAVMIISPGNF